MLTKIKGRIRIFLYYNKREVYGFMFLIVLLFFVFVGFHCCERYFQNTIDNSNFLAKADSLSRISKPKEKIVSYFSFNPNTADSSSLTKLGFSTKQIRMLLKYRKAGGNFRIKDDFKKLYFVDDSLYAVYQKYIVIPKVENRSKKKSAKTTKSEKFVKKQQKDSLFAFNPNTITVEEWQLLGVSERIAKNIAKYREKGGRFRKKEDLKKIYGFSEQVYSRLEAYVRIPQKVKKKKIASKYDLNTITKQQLEEIKVGKAMVYKLLKYRGKLGGYVSLEQLKEVRNLRKWDLKQLEKYCKIRKSVRQININKAEAKELYQHPYLDFREANAIIRYRERKGKYNRIEDLKMNKILSVTVFEKVKCYLKVKN